MPSFSGGGQWVRSAGWPPQSTSWLLDAFSEFLLGRRLYAAIASINLATPTMFNTRVKL
jgi:hypothetical protein